MKIIDWAVASSGRAFWVLYLVSVALSFRLFFTVTPDDDGWYFYVAERMAAGALPYRDVWDQKLPVQHFWTFLFGTSPIGSLPLLRGATLLVFTCVPYFAFVAVSELAESRRAGLISALALLFWFVPSREMNAVFLEMGFGVAAVLVLLILIVHKSRIRPGAAAAGFVVIGCLLGLSFATRPLIAPSLWLLTALLIGLTFGFASAAFRILLVGVGSVLTLLVVLLPFLLWGTLSDMLRMVWEFNILYAGQRNPFRSVQSSEEFIREIYDVRLYQLTFLGFSAIGGFAFAFLTLWHMIKSKDDHSQYAVLLAFSTVWFAIAGILIALPGGAGHLQYWMLCHVGLLVCSAWLIAVLFAHSGISGEIKAAILGSVMFLLLIPNLVYVGSIMREPDYNLPPAGLAQLASEARQSREPLPIFLWGSKPRLLVDLKLREVAAPTSLLLLRSRILRGPRGDAFYEEAWRRALADLERTPPLFILVTGEPGFLQEISAFEARIGSRLADYDLIDEQGQSKVYRRSAR
jgi:hypothetical protein